VLKNLTANGQGTLSQSFSGAFASGAAATAWPDWATYGGALGVVPWNPSLHLQGAIGTFFTLGATYRF
jgi:hypothetical protein